jgi:hypothetical protein
VRCINVAGWGFLAGYLTEEEAWDHIMPAARKIQQAYGSWETFGRAYMVGTAFWRAPRAEQNGQIARDLVANAGSPWNQIPWTTPLGGAAESRQRGSGIGGMWNYAVGCVLLLVLLSGVLFTVAAVAAIFVLRSPSSTPDVVRVEATEPAAVAVAPSDWDGSAPFVCGGNEKKAISGVTAKLTTGPAVLAQGSCMLVIRDTTIEAPIAVETSGSAKVTIEGGTLTGSKNAIVAGGASRINVSGTKVTGGVKKKGAAKVEGL